MRLIVGLGNPGPRYRCNRHNVGFRCVDFLSRTWGISLSERRAKAVLGQGQHLGHDVVLATPRTFMNNSGEGVAYLLTRFTARPSDLLVVYDDMALPIGKLRIRSAGSAGGHNGIKSIIATLKTQAFPRIRVGIGQPPSGQDPVAHVLGRIAKEESPLISEAVQRVAEALDCVFAEGIDVAMNRFN
jgi:PTH1 family peptidyl-tRNA hydrolase